VGGQSGLGTVKSRLPWHLVCILWLDGYYHVLHTARMALWLSSGTCTALRMKICTGCEADMV
jgi:hypothetical protein